MKQPVYKKKLIWQIMFLKWYFFFDQLNTLLNNKEYFIKKRDEKSLKSKYFTRTYNKTSHQW